MLFLSVSNLRKTAFLTLFIFSFLTSFQLSAKAVPLTFAGLEIDGDLMSMVEQLRQKGFTDWDYEYKGLYRYSLQGEYEGRKCNILIRYTPLTHKVFEVQIRLPFEKTDWKSVKKEYNQIKKRITKTFGSADYCSEEFYGNYEGVEEKEKGYVENCKYSFKTTWETKNYDDIRLEIGDDCIYLDLTNAINDELDSDESDFLNKKRQKWFELEMARRKALLGWNATKAIPEYHTGDFPITGDIINLNGMEFVDLGLPEGIRFASSNYGAERTYGRGEYIKWVDLWEKQPDNKDLRGKLHPSFYVSESAPEWYVPSEFEFRILFDPQYIYREKATLNGMEGYMIFSKVNFNYIFLPACGYLHDKQYIDREKSGFYWSSDTVPLSEDKAWTLYFDYEMDGYLTLNQQDIYDGCPIRPITYKRPENTDINTIANEIDMYKSCSLSIETSPENCTVRVDDKYYGNTPITIKELTPGTHQFVICINDNLLEGALLIEEKVLENECNHFNFTLEPGIVDLIKGNERVHYDFNKYRDSEGNIR